MQIGNSASWTHWQRGRGDMRTARGIYYQAIRFGKHVVEAKVPVLTIHNPLNTYHRE